MPRDFFKDLSSVILRMIIILNYVLPENCVFFPWIIGEASDVPHNARKRTSHVQDAAQPAVILTTPVAPTYKPLINQ